MDSRRDRLCPNGPNEDNEACIIAGDKSKPMSPRSRHIDTRVYKLRDLTNDLVLRLVKIATGEQMANRLTKALPAPAVETARDYFSGRSMLEGLTGASSFFSFFL